MKAKATAFEKRVKRHVIAKEHSFFVPVSPGLIDVCYDEIRKLELESTDIKKIQGGIEFMGSLNDCQTVNLFSRIGNRVLMRVLSFKATNFRSMEKKTEVFPWDLFINPQIPIELSVTSSKSRLIHTTAISEKMEAVINRVLAGSEMKASFDDSKTQKIFVRVVDDAFTISLDSTGENLHKRNLKTIGGPAPIRETIASALLTLSGFSEDKVLIDPMCGTGTFSMEAYMIGTNTPPGYYRDFSFQNWPGYRDARFKHIKKKASENIKVPDGQFIYASDKNGNLVDQFKNCVTKAGFEKNIDIETKDFFKFVPDLTGDKKKVVIFNPPFGQRMGSKGESEKIIKSIIEKLRKDYKGCRFGIILPFKDLTKKIPFKCRIYNFSHGGLKLTLAVSSVR
jgi:putative N6-adenine-specific DNA methylase